MVELVICDDEKVFRNDLKEILGTELDLCGIKYRMREYASGEELVDAIDSHDKCIIFLDIEMGKMDGMEAAKKIREKNRASVIIFVTSYSDYVFVGYEVQAFNYILKPYQKERIVGVLHGALSEADITEERFFVIEQRTGALRLLVKDIKYFISDKRMVTAVMHGKEHSFYGKLDEIAGGLPECFIRSHNRYLVNLSYVKAIDGNAAVVGEEKLPISRPFKQELSVAFARYMLE